MNITHKDPWNLLSKYFDTSGNTDEISSGAADNILVAWPVILAFIQDHSPKTSGLDIIEYGCGGGGFAHYLQNLGHRVTGIDSSGEMIEVAKMSYGTDVPFFTGNSSLLLQLEPVDVITSIMTLQFIEDIDVTLNHFSKALLPNGLLVFAVFNPQYVVDGLKEKLLFEGFDSEIEPKKGIINFGNGIRIPTYIRTARDYTRLAEKYHFKLLLEEYPKFTKEFLDKYPQKITGSSFEYLILGFRKK